LTVVDNFLNDEEEVVPRSRKRLLQDFSEGEEEEKGKKGAKKTKKIVKKKK
jgi:hypothetical protein